MPRRLWNLALLPSLLCGCATLQSLDKKVQPGGTLPTELIAKGGPGPATLPTLGPPPPLVEPMTLAPRLAAPAPEPVPKPSSPPIKPTASMAKVDPGLLLASATPIPKPEPPKAPERVEAPVVPKVDPPRPAELPRPRPTGRVVATVGDEAVTLPELTAAVKARLAELEAGEAGNLGRRQVIAVAKGVLKGLVARSLVEQEARERLGSSYEGVRRELETRWERNESKLVMAKEDAATEADLRRILARRQATPEAVRDEFLIRGLARELLDRQGSSQTPESFLDELAKRRPVRTVMTPAELAAEGKKEAENK